MVFYTNINHFCGSRRSLSRGYTFGIQNAIDPAHVDHRSVLSTNTAF